MSKFDGLRTKPLPSTSKFEGLRTRPSKKAPSQSNSGVAGRAFLSDALSVADLPQSILALAESMGNARAKYDPDLAFLRGEEEPIQTNVFSSSPGYVSSKIKEGIKNTTGFDPEPRPANPEQELIADTAGMAGSFLPFGWAGKGANLLSKFARTTGAGAAVGATSGALKQEGVNPLAADLFATAAVPFAGAAPKVAKHLGEKGLLKLGGLTPKNFKLDTALAAKQAGIDVPPAALTDSQWAALAHQTGKKLPIVGNIYKKAFNKTEDQITNKLKGIYNKVGPEDTAAARDLIEKRYTQAGNLLPEEAMHFPRNTVAENERIRNLISTSPVPSDAEKKVYNMVNTLDKNLALDNKVKGLMAGKRSLNSTINWDPEVRGALNLLKKPRKALEQDLAEYGATNPAWHKSYKKADELFSKVERRKQLEEHLGKVVNPYEEVSYPALAKAINKPEQTKALRHIVKDEETVKGLDNIGKIANAMALHNRNVPNPSGTAITGAVATLLYNLATNPLGTVTTIGGTGLSAAVLIPKLGTDKRFVDLAIKHAQNPANLANTIALEKRIKEVTGYSAAALNRELSQQQGGKNNGL